MSETLEPIHNRLSQSRKALAWYDGQVNAMRALGHLDAAAAYQRQYHREARRFRRYCALYWTRRAALSATETL